MIKLPEFTENVNIHQSLPDQPTLTPTELKIKWDEGVSKIKTYINDVLLPNLKNGLAEEFEAEHTSIMNAVNDLMNTFKEGVSADISNMRGDITAFKNEINQKIGAVESSIQTINNSISSINSKLSTVANATAVSVTAGSGITLAHPRVIKQGNVVSFYVRITCNIPAKTSRTMFTFPSGARPTGTVETMAIWSNGDFDGRVPAYINSSGVCSLTTSSVAMTDCVIEGQFII